MYWKNLIEKRGQGIAVRIHIRKAFSWGSLIMHTLQKVGNGSIIVASGPKRSWFPLSNLVSKRTRLYIDCL